MPELTHKDLDDKLRELEVRSDKQHAELLSRFAELHVLVAGKTAEHGTMLCHHEGRIDKIEDREWRVAGAMGLGLLSFIGTAVLTAITFLL